MKLTEEIKQDIKTLRKRNKWVYILMRKYNNNSSEFKFAALEYLSSLKTEKDLKNDIEDLKNKIKWREEYIKNSKPLDYHHESGTCGNYNDYMKQKHENRHNVRISEIKLELADLKKQLKNQ